MWGKSEQFILWFTAYVPLMLIMAYRFIDSNNYFKKTKFAHWLSNHIDKMLFDLFIIVGIIIVSLFLYRIVTHWFLKDYDGQLKRKEIGQTVAVRKYEKLNVNEYTFFLMSLLLPLVSLDHKSVINLIVSIMIIVIVIVIFIKTDYISVCPLFFTSGRRVYKAVISDQTRQTEAIDPSVRKYVIIITREKDLNLNNKFRVQKLISNIYYLSSINS
jgi:hypothetical protein